jgi:hypothetical protein
MRVPSLEIYYAVTRPAAWRQWAGDWSDLDPQAGGRLYLWRAPNFYACGEFVALNLEQGVAFTWQERGEGLLLVEITWKIEGEGMRVTLSAAGENAEASIDQFWQEALEDLQAVLETGARAPRRALLGLVGGEALTPRRVAEMQLPVTEGFYVAGVIEGVGVHAAGLRRDDVIVSLDDQPVTSMDSFPTILEKRRPGERVPIVFYRQGLEQRAEVLLFARSVPEVPPSAAALAGAVRTIYEQQKADIADLLAGMSEGAAAAAPDSGGWSVMQVLAHLITTERASHVRVALLLAGQDVPGWSNDVDPWVNAVVESHGTLAGLWIALRQAQAETVALLGALPAAFVAHKGDFAQLAWMYLQELPYHTQLHFDQIRGD